MAPLLIALTLSLHPTPLLDAASELEWTEASSTETGAPISSAEAAQGRYVHEWGFGPTCDAAKPEAYRSAVQSCGRSGGLASYQFNLCHCSPLGGCKITLQGHCWN